MGVPVVSSTAAIAGVDAVPGEHIVRADTPADFAAAVVRLLADSAERRRLAENGRARMLSHHSWPASMKRLDAIIEDCMTKRMGG